MQRKQTGLVILHGRGRLCCTDRVPLQALWPAAGTDLAKQTDLARTAGPAKKGGQRCIPWGVTCSSMIKFLGSHAMHAAAFPAGTCTSWIRPA